MSRAPIIVTIIVAATLAAYWPAVRCSFVFDDDDYVVNNRRVASGLSLSNVRWALGAVHSANWHPITWISHMTDVSLYGLRPRGHHITNLIIHALNASLLFLLLRHVTGASWRSAFVACLFALHPLNVESVAWIAERKNLLCMLFALLSVWAYVHWARNSRPRSWFVLSLASFLFSLASKPMSVMLPLLLLVLDYWPLDRLRLAASGKRRWALVIEKLPFLALSAAVSLLTVLTQHSAGAVASAERFGIEARVANALASYAIYLGKTVWPAGLAAYYPYPGSFSPWGAGAAFVFLICASVLVWVLRRRHPWLIAGWLWYLIALLPMIGIIQAGAQARADRYTYLPFIGVLVAAAWEGVDLVRRVRLSRLIAASLAVLLLALLAATTWVQVHWWESDLKLFSHAVEVTGDNCFAHYNLGCELQRRGRHDLAFRQFQTAALIEPDCVQCQNNVAVSLIHLGRNNAALSVLLSALRQGLGSADIYFNCYAALKNLGRTREAEPYLLRAAALDPKYARTCSPGKGGPPQ